MIPQVQNKLKDVEEWALKAYQLAIQGEKYTALNNARKAGEAICKAVIYQELGDDVGDSFVKGEVTLNIKIPDSPKSPSFAGLSEAICSPKMDTKGHFQDKELKYYLETLRTKGNKGSHDITDREKEDITYTEVVYTMMALSNLLSYVFNSYFNTAIPISLTTYIDKKEGHYFIAQQSKLPIFRKRRMKSLEEIISDNYQLIEEWEKRKVYTTDPTERMKCKAEISRLKGDVTESENEYNNLLNL